MSGFAIAVIILFSDLVFLPLFLIRMGLVCVFVKVGIFLTNGLETMPISVKREEAFYRLQHAKVNITL
jgi:hypothetical protein